MSNYAKRAYWLEAFITDQLGPINTSFCERSLSGPRENNGKASVQQDHRIDSLGQKCPLTSRVDMIWDFRKKYPKQFGME